MEGAGGLEAVYVSTKSPSWKAPAAISTLASPQTIAILMTNASQAFSKAAQAPSGTNVYTLGSLSARGETQFKANGNGGVQIDYLENSTGTVNFDCRDVTTLKQLIAQALSQP